VTGRAGAVYDGTSLDRKRFLRNLSRSGWEGELTAMATLTKGSKAGKRYPLGMRTTKFIREQLEEAAIANGRSLAQEVEYRLERSFLDEEIIGGRRAGWWAHEMVRRFHAGAMTRALAKGGLGADDDQDCYRAGLYALIEFLFLDLFEIDTAENVEREITAIAQRALTRGLKKEQSQ
jgi:hypothetical protein